MEITGPDHGFTYVNHAFETTTGYAQAEALGRQPQDMLSSGEHAPEFFEAMRARAADRQAVAGDDRQPPPRRPPDRAGDHHRAAARRSRRTITHYVAVKRDVTEARAQARALAESEARYRAVVEAQTEFIVRIRPDGYWTFMNEAAERYIGMTLEEMRSRGLHDYELHRPRGPPPLRRAHGADHPRQPDQRR